MTRRPNTARRMVLPAVLSALTLLVGSAPAGAATVPASSASRTALFSPDWKDVSKRSDAQWDAAARSFPVIVGHSDEHGERLPRMRSLNPALFVLKYDLGPYLWEGSSDYNKTLRSHPEYFARDAAGALIRVKQQPKMVLMDQSQPGWRALHVARTQAAVAEWGYDGTYVDCMGWGPTQGYTNAKPVNRATGQPYTAAEWLRLSVLSLDAVKAAMGSKYVMYNGLADGPTYTASSKILATSKADGGLAEGFVRQALAPISAYPTPAQWKANLDMMVDVQARGQDFYGWTKTWTTATAAQQSQWNTFALATYLLGKGSDSYYNFLPRTGVDRTVLGYPNLTADLGAPLGSYRVSGGVYTRKFTKGTVTVDPAARKASIVTTR